MSPGEPSCASCGAERPRAPGTGELCGACLDRHYPPISSRGEKWSPFALGVASLLCDPLMIPTLLALARGVGELREAGRRERAGIYREEHASVRTGAVWGIVLAAVRPLGLALIFLVGFAADGLGAEPSPPILGADEVTEILERVRSEDEATRELALDHLYEVAPSLTEPEASRVLDTIEPDYRPRLDEDVRASIADSAMRAHGAANVTERVARLYPTLGPFGREAILERLATTGTPDALAQLGRLVERDVDPEGPELPDLRGHRDHAHLFVPALVGLPPGASLRADVPPLLADLCDEGLASSVLQPVRSRLLEDARAALGEVGAPGGSLADQLATDRVILVAAARAQLDALRCVDGDDVDHALATAAAHEEPRVAVAAARALLRRGGEVDRATVVRLAADPHSRSDLVVAMRARDREREVPAAHRSERAIAESHLLTSVDLIFEPPHSYEWVERVEAATDQHVHVFAVRFVEGDAPVHVALGPYPAALDGGPTIVWEHDIDELGGPLGPALAAALLDWRAEAARESAGEEVEP